MSVRLLDVEADSFAYIRGQLSAARGLGHLLNRLNLESGRVQACIPDDLPSLVDGYESGSLRNETQETEVIAALAQHLVRSMGLTSDSSLALIGQFTEGARERSDEIDANQDSYRIAWLTGAKPAYFNGELWYVSKEADAQAVETMLHDLLWFPAVAVLTKLPSGSCVNGVIDFQALWEIVQTPEAVFVGGWDATNYLMWTPIST